MSESTSKSPGPGFVYENGCWVLRGRNLIEELNALRKALEELEIEASRLVEFWDGDNHPDDYPQIWEARRLLGKLPESATRPAT